MEIELESRHWWQMVKPNQGRYVRAGTAIGAGIVALVLAYYMFSLLESHVSKDLAYKQYLIYVLPAVFLVILCGAVAYFMNRPGVVDFLIATESEMKKVSWSSRAELFGSTFVVIVTVFLLADFIFVVDLLFAGGLSNGIAFKWSEQSFRAKVLFAAHLLILLVVASYVVKYLIEKRQTGQAQNASVSFGIPAAVFVLLAAVSVFFWLRGIKIPGLGLW